MATKKNEKTTKKRYATHLTTPAGKRVYISAKSQEELDRKVQQAKMEMGAGVDISDNTSFKDYAWLWMRTYKAPPKLRQNSYDTLVWHLENNIIPFFEGKALRDVKPLHIQAWLNSVGVYSHSTQAKCLQIVRGIFASAADNGLILKSPVRTSDKPAGAKTKDKEALSDEQAAALLKATEGTRAYLFCLLALSTGMRRSEILGLMWDDIDFHSGLINVQHSKTLPPRREDWEVSDILKSESAYRRLPMPPLLLKTLEEERRNSKSPFVLSMRNGESLSRNSYGALWRIVTNRTASDTQPLGSQVTSKRTGETYTVSLDFHCTPHLLRHTYITQLFEAGLDIKQVQYLAGHSTPDMTLKVYTHYRQKSREQETADQVRDALSYLEGSPRELRVSNGTPIRGEGNVRLLPKQK